MKKILLFLFVSVQVCLFAQYSNQVKLNLENEKDFPEIQFDFDEKMVHFTSKWVTVENYPNQPFIAMTPYFKSEEILEDFFIAFRTDNEFIEIAKDPHTAPNIHAGAMQSLDTNTSSVQFKISLSTEDVAFLDELVLSFYYPGNTPPKANFSSNFLKSRGSADCDCEIPDFEGRDDWCPIPFNCPPQANPSFTNVSHLIVHHSATPNSSSDWAAVVRSIHNSHTNTNGWADIGYNYLIDPNGVIYEGRGDNIRGAHFSCMNNNTMGICLLGNYEEANPSQEMLDALVKLLGWKSCDIDASPIGSAPFAGSGNDTVLFRISGHRNGNGLPNACTATACPGENVYSQINSIRANTSSFIENCEINNVPEPENSDIVIVALESEPTMPEEGETVNLTARIRNIGEAAITQPFNTSLQINGDEIDNFTTPSLNVFEFADFNTSYVFEEEGTYQYCIFADGAHNEVNTANNSFCINIQVEADGTSVPISEQDLKSLINVYPNPAQNQFVVESSIEMEHVEMFNAIGQKVFEINHRTFQETVDVSKYSEGIYFLKIYSNEGVAQIKVNVGE